MSVIEPQRPKAKGRPFQPGQSGNPNGKPKGARNATTLAMEALLEGEAEALARKAVDLALAGDVTALRLCMDRLCPTRKDRTVAFHLPEIASAADAKHAASAILDAVAAGDLTPLEAADVVKVLETYTKILEATELEERLARLEEKTNQ
ncbi:DUF5681 domain-containing protein [Alsobacter sp. SYSU BS001988]